MKILLAFVFIFVFVFNGFGLPLLYKSSKEIKGIDNDKFADLFTLNTSKFKKIRIALQKRNLDSGEQEQTRGFRVYAVENDEDVFLGWFDGYSAVMDAPSSQIKVKVNEIGTYKIYVWGE